MIQTYFIFDGELVKIGRSKNVHKRLQGLQLATPRQLTLLQVIDGDHEKKFHTLYQDYRVRGEWFRVPFAENFELFVVMFLQVRNTFVGDFAEDLAGDRRFPKTNSYAEIRSYLHTCHACKEALIGFAMAYREWVKVRRSLGKTTSIEWHQGERKLSDNNDN